MAGTYEYLADMTASENRFQGKAEGGRFDAGGSLFPKSAVGVGNVIVVKQNGRYKALIAERGKDLAHAKKLGLLGGYLDQQKGEDIPTASRREILEETNGLLDIKGVEPTYLPPAFMDYNDPHNGQCCSHGIMYLLPPEKARIVLEDIIRDGKGTTSETTKFSLIDLEDIDKEIDRLGGIKEFGYIQDAVYLVRASKALSLTMSKSAGRST